MPTDAAMHRRYRLVEPDAVVDGVIDAGYRPPVEQVRALVGQGSPVLVRCAPADGPRSPLAETIAMVSVYAWLGVQVFATDHPREAQQALDMVASVQGLRPPSAARRGLA